MFDAYLKIDSIPGECTDKGHEKWIQIQSFSHGLTQPHSEVGGGGSRGGTSRCQHQDFSFSKFLDAASTQLNLHCCNGVNLKKVTLEICRQTDTKEVYLKYEFETCLVANISIGGGGGGLPMENVSLTYAKITWTYTGIDPTTNQAAQPTVSYWDLLTNVGG
jgi:type VI secretion system secreted protein Hcp